MKILLAAVGRVAHGADELADLDALAGVLIERCTGSERRAFEGDVDAEHELVDRDGAIPVTISAAGWLGLGRRGTRRAR